MWTAPRLLASMKPPLDGRVAAAQRRIATAKAALDLFDPLRGEAVEIAAFAYLDPEWRLLGLRHACHGSRDSLLLSMRDIAADAIAFGATGIVMAHNHPSGDPTPSAADRDATRRIAQALGTLQVRLAEHLVLTQRGQTSFRALGLL